MERFSEPKKLTQRGRPSRYYYVRVTSEDGSRVWKSTGVSDRLIANEVLRRWRLEAAQGQHAWRPMTFREIGAKWWTWKKPQLRPRSEYQMQWCLDALLERFGDVRCGSLTREAVDAWLAEEMARGLSPVTVNGKRSLLSSILQWGCDEGLIEANPARRALRFRVERHAIRTLSDEEGARLLEAAARSQLRVYMAVLILYYSGLRRGTVAQLEWCDIDFEKKEWRIPARKMKSREDYFGRPIDSTLFEHLVAHRQVTGRVCGSLDHEAWEKIAERAGLSDVLPHDLRRSFVTRCRRAGIDLDTTMWLSDHRDLKTVLGSYRRVDSDDGRRALARLSQVGKEPACAHTPVGDTAP